MARGRNVLLAGNALADGLRSPKVHVPSCRFARKPPSRDALDFAHHLRLDDRSGLPNLHRAHPDPPFVLSFRIEPRFVVS